MMSIQDNFLTESECENIIYKYSISRKFKALRYHHNVKYPDRSFPYFVRDVDITNLIRDRLDSKGLFKGYKIYDHIRLVHYHPGQNTPVHKDLKYLNNSMRAEYTIFVYLNQDFSGGKTRIYGVSTSDNKNFIHGMGDCNDKHIDISPSVGKMVIYDINTVHEGLRVDCGEKLILICKLFHE